MMSRMRPRANRRHSKVPKLCMFSEIWLSSVVRLHHYSCFKAVIIAQNNVEQFALFLFLTQWNIPGFSNKRNICAL